MDIAFRAESARRDMPTASQYALFSNEDAPRVEQVLSVLTAVFQRHEQPSAWELVGVVERELGWKARWFVKQALNELIVAPTSQRAWREYLNSIIESNEIDAALAGTDAPKREIVSTIDALLRDSAVYRYSEQFAEMVQFMARFRDYAPYNNMLVRVQDPTCSFYASRRDWRHRFDRKLKEDARPMLILAPMHPVMLVYALNQTEGKEVPEELRNFATYKGDWNSAWMQRTIGNAALRDRIRVDFKQLSDTNAGFATVAHDNGEWKMRIAIHAELDEPSRYGTLCHELAHIYLGHLGSGEDRWWPSRTDLDGHALEIEAEAVAFIVTARRGLAGSSAAYVSRHLHGKPLPPSVSLDQVAKVAGRIELMADQRLPPRKQVGGKPS